MTRLAIHPEARGTDMRRWISVLSAIALASGLAAFAVAQDASEDEEALKGMAAKWAEAWNAGDMKGVGDLYTDDSDYVDLFGQSHKGRTDIEAVFGGLKTTAYEGATLSIETKAVHFVKPDLAVLDSVWELAGVPDAEGAPPSKGQSTVVCTKQDDGQWKIVAHRSRVPQSAVPVPDE